MMTKEEIIEMAKKCGWDNPAINMSPLYEFAKLVAEKERDECVKRANIALLGTLTTTKDRVLKSICARGQE